MNSMGFLTTSSTLPTVPITLLKALPILEKKLMVFPFGCEALQKVSERIIGGGSKRLPGSA
jgi:hypothetical protein